MSEKKNRGGRPKKPIFEQDLLKKIDEYVSLCQEQNKPILIEGFANYAGIGWTTFHERKKEFLNAYKKIRDIAKQHLLEKTLEGKYNPTFAIFLAKNNYDMRDRQEIDNTGEFEIKIVREAK